ncbi:MAG: hypothetical protein CMM46_02060 [Rhodospirillaceae bacterium]|nr:hypothetical protein [Rhodospirillaceae bacterium]|tara:strand:- start:1958 stop:3190 length:1233 start_codon:yes stop_codon:yes gene_type:complete
MTAVNRVFFGWWVAWTGFLMALFAWGFGFYGSAIYLGWLTEKHGWDLAEVSLAVTVFYAVSAGVVVFSADVFKCLGHRRACLIGMVAIAIGPLAMPLLTEPWQMWLAFLVMAPGWAFLGTAGVNIVLAPWFQKRRGFVVSLSLNGASMGSVVIAPVIVLLAGFYGPVTAIVLTTGLMLATLGVFAWLVLHHSPAAMGLAPDGGAADPAAKEEPAEARSKRALLKSWQVWSIALPFAVALFVQVGVLTHQFRFLIIDMSEGTVALIMSLTGIMAVTGRVGTGMIIDRIDRRRAGAVNFAVQAAGLAVVIVTDGPWGQGAGWMLFGLGVGNQVTLYGLIAHVEFTRADFARAMAVIVAICQFTYAFGPGLIGAAADVLGYGAAFGGSVLLLLVASVLVVAGRPKTGSQGPQS